MKHEHSRELAAWPIIHVLRLNLVHSEALYAKDMLWGICCQRISLTVHARVANSEGINSSLINPPLRIKGLTSTGVCMPSSRK